MCVHCKKKMRISIKNIWKGFSSCGFHKIVKSPSAEMILVIGLKCTFTFSRDA